MVDNQRHMGGAFDAFKPKCSRTLRDIHSTPFGRGPSCSRARRSLVGSEFQPTSAARFGNPPLAACQRHRRRVESFNTAQTRIDDDAGRTCGALSLLNGITEEICPQERQQQTGITLHADMRSLSSHLPPRNRFAETSTGKAPIVFRSGRDVDSAV